MLAIVAGVGVSVATALFLNVVGLPMTSPLSLLIGLICGSILVGYMVNAEGVRGWANAVGAELLAQAVVWFAIIELIT